jgi:hypothetical protein
MPDQQENDRAKQKHHARDPINVSSCGLVFCAQHHIAPSLLKWHWHPPSPTESGWIGRRSASIRLLLLKMRRNFNCKSVIFLSGCTKSE